MSYRDVYKKTFNELPHDDKAKYVFIANEIAAKAIMSCQYHAIMITTTERDEVQRFTLDDLFTTLNKAVYASCYVLLPCLDKASNKAIIEYCNNNFILTISAAYTVFHNKEYMLYNDLTADEGLRDNLKAFWQRYISGGATYEKRKTDDIDTFKEHIADTKTKLVKTSISWFDSLVGGIRRQSLVNVVACPACGKTAFMQFVAESLAKQGYDVRYICLEMSTNDMIARAICRFSADSSNKLTTGDVLYHYADYADTIDKALTVYNEAIYEHIRYIDYVDPLLDAIISCIRCETAEAVDNGKSAPIFVIDYLHLIKTGKKQEVAADLAEIVLKLKRLAIELNTIVFTISASSRESFKGKISMTASRDTSNIEYTADIIIGLNFKALEADTGADVNVERSKETREMICKVLKNRNGYDGLSKDYYFDPKHMRIFVNNDNDNRHKR